MNTYKTNETPYHWSVEHLFFGYEGHEFGRGHSPLFPLDPPLAAGFCHSLADPSASVNQSINQSIHPSANHHPLPIFILIHTVSLRSRSTVSPSGGSDAVLDRYIDTEGVDEDFLQGQNDNLSMDATRCFLALVLQCDTDLSLENQITDQASS